MNFNRILIKLSGQMLGDKGSGFNHISAARTVKEIQPLIDSKIEIAILVGGGNIMRARDTESIDQLSADYMGMTGTIINALGLKSILNAAGIESKIMSALKIDGVCEGIDPQLAIKHLSDGQIVIFAGGTGKPYVTTDTAAAMRAVEIEADLLAKATRVKGVYTGDPEKDSEYEFIEEVTYKDALDKGLKIMDESAFDILKESGINTVVFNFLEDGNLVRLMSGEKIGTLIKSE